LNISVVIPAFNAGDTIEKTLEAFLRQIKMPDEIIVVDSNSTDKTAEKVGKFITANPSLKTILDKERKKGPSAARNKGSLLSKGDVIAFIDADEVPPEGWVQTIEKETAKDTDVVFGPVSEYSRETFLRKYLDVMQTALTGEREVFKADIHNDKFLFAGNFAIKKDLFFQIGKFDEKIELGEDVDLSKRIYRCGKSITYNPEMAAIHKHKETFKGRFKKSFGYGVLQAKFLKEYFNRELNIVFSGKKTLYFKFPLKMRLYLFSILSIALLLFIFSFLNSFLMAALGILFTFSVILKVSGLIAKSGKKISLFNRILFLLYWVIERAIFDLGKVWGSFKYRVICI